MIDENCTRSISRAPLIARDIAGISRMLDISLAGGGGGGGNVEQSARTLPRGKTAENSPSSRSLQRDARWLVVYIRATTSAIAALSNFPRRAIPASTGGWRGWVAARVRSLLAVAVLHGRPRLLRATRVANS